MAFESVTQAGSALAQTAGIDGEEANANIIELLTRLIAGGFSISDAGVITLTGAPVFPGTGITGITNANISASAAIALSKLADISTAVILGRDTAGSGAIEQLTAAEVRTLLSLGALALLSTVGTAQIDNDAVTFAKIQNLTDARLLGRSAGSSGDAQEITVGSGLSLSAGALTATATGAMTLLTANSGTDTNAAATNVDTYAVTGLTAKDKLVIYFGFQSVTQDTAAIIARNDTDAVSVGGLSNGAALAAGMNTSGLVTIRQLQSAATAVESVTVMNLSAAGGAVRGDIATFTTNWTGSWTLALRHGGVTAGGTLRWAWEVYKVAGQ